MECVITGASLHRVQQEENQTDAAVPGTTEGYPGETYTRALDSQWRRRRLIRQRQKLLSSDKVIVEVK